ncbi:hypothetical protein [Streptomyces sp. SID5770]|uniref:hypothetical protein n=1 Tax=Streptomyces sp. SID5770 TaxID=2690308 RepID=UPI00136D76CB|nr:hypothetical protein [Streptomyces sp. SID5770]
MKGKTMTHRPDDVIPDKVTVARAFGMVKLRITLDGKTHKVLMTEKVFEELEVKSGNITKELTLKEGNRNEEDLWER